MHNQGGNVDFLQVFREVGLGKSLDEIVLPLDAALHPSVCCRSARSHLPQDRILFHYIAFLFGEIPTFPPGW